MRNSEKGPLRQRCARHWGDMQAFTLIELMIVIAIIAIIAAIAIPNLLRARASANEESAISSLRTLVSAQALFSQRDIGNDSSREYATDLVELTYDDLIDKVLGTGVKSGYVFILSNPSQGTWDATAWPSHPLAGLRHFYADQTGIIRFGICGNGIVEAGEECDPAGGIDDQSCSAGLACSQRCRCEGPTAGQSQGSASPASAVASLAAARLALETDMRRQAIDALRETNELAAGVALMSTRRLLSRGIVERLLHALDADGDGRLGFDELLEADILAAARSLALRLPGIDFSLTSGEEPLASATSAYQEALAQSLRLGVAQEQELPSIDIAPLVASEAADFLWLVPQPPLVVALQQLDEFVRGLDPDPDASEMVAESREANEARKARLEHLVANWPHQLLANDRARLRSALESARQRAVEWLSGSAALHVTRQIDDALRLLGTG